LNEAILTAVEAKPAVVERMPDPDQSVAEMRLTEPFTSNMTSDVRQRSTFGHGSNLTPLSIEKSQCDALEDLASLDYLLSQMDFAAM